MKNEFSRLRMYNEHSSNQLDMEEKNENQYF